jgi:hypothetical protein
VAEHIKALILSGVLFVAIGGVLLSPNVFGLGRLPGDVHARAGKVSVPFPVGTSILVGVLLTLVVALVMRAL